MRLPTSYPTSRAKLWLVVKVTVERGELVAKAGAAQQVSRQTRTRGDTAILANLANTILQYTVPQFCYYLYCYCSFHLMIK